MSGGESTLNADILLELFKKVKEELSRTCFENSNWSLDLSKKE
ncbi:radical SAM protein [Clostridium gasigenes]|nr:radical SAM protein [Clostridium gasigenes]MBU3138276.1 radical SAM protein [Clostridium gasigenes]